jgi:tRNA(Ile)-lysidine synthetase-like protein
MNNLFTFWFPNNKYQAFWFDGSKDQEIYQQFNDLLINEEKKSVHEILDMNSKDQLCYIILYDQITRNISRITKDSEYRNDDKAIMIAINLCSIDCDLTADILQSVFIWLPFRHTNKTNDLDFIVGRLNKYKYTDSNESDFSRFYLATLKSYTQTQDTIQIITNQNKKLLEIPVYDQYIHDDNCETYQCIQTNDKISDLDKNVLYTDILKYINKYKIKKLGVSLSGGVDSMVLITLLHQMVLRKQLEQVVAMHIDYKFRKESTDEANFLVNICLHLNIPIILREITHFNNCKIKIQRDFEEEETKCIRFNVYKYGIEKFQLDGICLGHHADDLIENVFMNIFNGDNILDLFVMKDKSINNDVPIMRPMLTQHKDVIFDIAHQNSVLYFKDTTPDWSFRGHIRRKIFPAIANFDPLKINNLLKIGNQSREWETVINQKMISPVIHNIQYEKHGFIVKFQSDCNNMPVAYWTQLFINIFHKQNIRMISQKNTKAFIEWTNKKNRDNVMFRLSNGYVIFSEGFDIYFLKMSVYNKLLVELKQPITIEEKTCNIKVSDWEINIETDNASFDENNNRYMSYQDILRGEYIYYIRKIDGKQLTVSVHEKEKDRSTFNKFKNVKILSHIVPKVYGEKYINDGNMTKIVMDL